MNFTVKFGYYTKGDIHGFYTVETQNELEAIQSAKQHFIKKWHEERDLPNINLVKFWI